MLAPVSIYTDGASRGNPGPAAIAYHISGDGVLPVECGETIGVTTNNVAEYRAMISALAAARQLGARIVRLHSDSELMVKQMRGEYRVKHPDIVPLFEEGRRLVADFDAVEFIYVPRRENAEADRLCNEALDGRPTPQGWMPSSNKTRLDPVASTSDENITRFLQELRKEWASHDGETRSVEEVWRQLRELLKTNKMLKGAARRRSG